MCPILVYNLFPLGIITCAQLMMYRGLPFIFFITYKRHLIIWFIWSGYQCLVCVLWCEFMSQMTLRPCLFYESQCHKHKILLVDNKCLNQRHLLNELCGLFEQVTMWHILLASNAWANFIASYWEPTISCRKVNEINTGMKSASVHIYKIHNMFVGW